MWVDFPFEARTDEDGKQNHWKLRAFLTEYLDLMDLSFVKILAVVVVLKDGEVEGGSTEEGEEGMDESTADTTTDGEETDGDGMGDEATDEMTADLIMIDDMRTVIGMSGIVFTEKRQRKTDREDTPNKDGEDFPGNDATLPSEKDREKGKGAEEGEDGREGDGTEGGGEITP
jgi:hypothetical protein